MVLLGETAFPFLVAQFFTSTGIVQTLVLVAEFFNVVKPTGLAY